MWRGQRLNAGVCRVGTQRVWISLARQEKQNSDLGEDEPSDGEKSSSSGKSSSPHKSASETSIEDAVARLLEDDEEEPLDILDVAAMTVKFKDSFAASAS